MIYGPCHAVGGQTAYGWEHDPKRLAFTLARYKFVARMLEGRESVLEVGCGDGFGSRIVRQHVGALTAIDIDADSIREAQAQGSARWPVRFLCGDVMKDALPTFAAVYCLDVFEHVAEERAFLASLRRLAPVAVIGIPSLESQVYASELSKAGHVNCKSGADFKRALLAHWKHVFLFSMNDEVVHTGFYPMAHYLLAVAVE